MSRNVIFRSQTSDLNSSIDYKISNVLIIAICGMLAVVTFLPFYFMIINSTYDLSRISTQLNLFPGDRLIENYQTMIENVNIWTGFKNSLIISLTSTILSIYISTLASYAFYKYKFKGKEVLFWIVMAAMMVPYQISMTGFLKIMLNFNLYDSQIGLILSALGNAYIVFFQRMYIESTIPTSIVESARIDSCGEFKIFNYIIIPMIVPSLATMFIFTFIASWNSFLMPLILLSDMEKQTLPIKISLVKGLYNEDIGAQYVAVALSIIPIMILFIFSSRYIISGLTTGAVKG